MKLKNKIIYVVLIFVVVFLILSGKSYAGTQKWNSLNYDVTVNEDGSMEIIETWDIEISQTNTLFETINNTEPGKKINYEMYSPGLNNGYPKLLDITNVKVTRIEDNKEIPLKKIDQKQYHVDSGCFYALQVGPTNFEIAWHVGVENKESRKYKIYYTVKDVVRVHNDCTELYWKFLNEENEIAGKNVTGTIKLPKGVSDTKKLRIWAHGSLSGKIKKKSNDTINFSVPKLYENTMLEVRIVTEENIYFKCKNVKNDNYLENIIREEKHWAGESNNQRVKDIIYVIIDITIFLIIVITFYKQIKKLKEMRKELQQKYSMDVNEIQYFREIPDEVNATPARALYLYHLTETESYMESYVSEAFSSTILDLSLRGYIKFEPINDNMFKIIFNRVSKIDLPDDEKAVYKILREIYQRVKDERNYITSKELSEYTADCFDEIENLGKGLKTLAESNHKTRGNIDLGKLTILKAWAQRRSHYSVTFLLLFASAFYIFPFITETFPSFLFKAIAIYVIIFAGLITCINIIGGALQKVTILTEKGAMEQQMWKGLKKYMEDFSLLKEKNAPDIVLWEKFLVYATAFGISEKVIEQLKIVYPEMFNDDYYDYDDDDDFSFWNMMVDNRIEKSFTDFSREIEKSYKTARRTYESAGDTISSGGNFSSGDGSGGGFSKGGGGRKRRRPCRRSMKLFERP